MTTQDYSTTISVDESPGQVFAAVVNVRGWWSGDIEGDTERLGGTFTYRYKDVHRSTQQITELVAAKRVVWRVTDSSLQFVKHKDEWTGTQIVFDISEHDGKTVLRFTHAGLVPQDECYGSCSNAWTMLINGNLRRLITTGLAQPDVFQET